MKKLRVKFKEWNCFVNFTTYGSNDTTAIELVIDDSGNNPKDCFPGEPVAVASVNLPDYPLSDGYVHIKNWSENDGVLQCLLDAKIIELTGHETPTGRVVAPVCKILIDIKELQDERV